MMKNYQLPPLKMPPERALWYNRDLPEQLGCAVCPDRPVCGGLRVSAPILGCHQLCSCARHGKSCSGVCRSDQATFVRFVNDVNGFEFGNVPRCRPLQTRPLPDYAPMIYDGTDRHGLLKASVVAMPLLSLFDRRSGTGKFEDRQELLRHFRLAAGTRIILTGIDKDPAIERWWSFCDRPRLIRTLRHLGIEMVTSPNYSLFTDVTRHDNLHKPSPKKRALSDAANCSAMRPGKCQTSSSMRFGNMRKRWPSSWSNCSSPEILKAEPHV